MALNYYENMTDEEIVSLAEKDRSAEEFLLNKYKNLVKSRAKMYFLAGGDNDDLMQEGMIGLFKAIHDYNSDKQASFYSFAELCVKRQIFTAIKTAARQKHQPLNTYISLNKPVYDEESERTLLDIIATSIVTDPEELIISKEGNLWTLKSFI